MSVILLLIRKSAKGAWNGHIGPLCNVCDVNLLFLKKLSKKN